MLRREQQFQQALTSREIIGQAMGMIMERYNIDGAKTFELLCKLSHMCH
jgi:AmiR/NasT family two-component response regulator